MIAPPPVPFDEMHAPDGSVREPYREYQRWLSEQDDAWMRRKAGEAESFFRHALVYFPVFFFFFLCSSIIFFDPMFYLQVQ